MTVPIERTPAVQPEPAQIADNSQDLHDALDRVDDVVLNDDGELQIVWKDEPESSDDADNSSDTDGTEPGDAQSQATEETGAGGPPQGVNDPELRAWATRLAQKNAELAKRLEGLEGKAREDDERAAGAEALQDEVSLLRHVARALPEDMTEILHDRGQFAEVVGAIASRLVAKKLEGIREIRSELNGLANALRFTTELHPEVSELRDNVKEIVQHFAATNGGANAFEVLGEQQVVLAARELQRRKREMTTQRQSAQESAPTTDADKPRTPGAPKTSAGGQPKRDAQQVDRRGAAAASAQSVGVGNDSSARLGKPAQPRNLREAILEAFDEVYVGR